MAVVSLVVCMGGAPSWTSWLLLGSASVALLTWTIGASSQRRRAGWHPLMTLLCGLGVVAALSLIPLPAMVLGLLSPANAELRDFALVPLGLEAARPLTMDSPSTWRALARLFSLSATAFVSLQLGRRAGSRRRLLSVIAITGGLTVVVGFGHLLAGAETLFGTWRYFANVPLVSFFGNQNHLAAYLGFSGTVALGLALETRSREQAIAWAAIALGCGVGVFLSLSRGGIATFVVTWALVGGLHLARKQGGVRAALPWLVIGATGIFAIALASDQLLDRLATLSTVQQLHNSKLDLWPMFWDGAMGYSRGGMGLGSFELAFSRFQTEQLDFTFTHPENLVLQWVSELGVSLSVLLLGASVFVGWRMSQQARGAILESTVLIGVLGVGLHDLFDFALELNGLPVSVVVALGVCAAREQEGADESSRRVHVRRSSLGLCVVLVAAGVFALTRGLPPHADAEQRVLAQVEAQRPASEVRVAAVQAIDRHPADWVLYSAVAHELSRQGAPRESLAWTNRVLFLRPRDTRAHVAAGRALLRLGQPTQALLEFKTAWLLGDNTSLDEGLVLAAQQSAYDRLLVDTPGLLTKLWERYRLLGKLAEGQALLDAVELLPPSSEVLAEAQILAVLQSDAMGRPADVVTRLEALPGDVQARPELVVLAANSLSKLGRADEGIKRLDVLARKEPQNASVAVALASLLGQERRTSEGRDVLNRSRPFVATPRGRAMMFVQEADLWIVDDRLPRALEALQTASRIEPDRAEFRYRVAQVYERMGRFRSALEEARAGCQLDNPQGASVQAAWVARLEAAARGSKP